VWGGFCAKLDEAQKNNTNLKAGFHLIELTVQNPDHQRTPSNLKDEKPHATGEVNIQGHLLKLKVALINVAETVTKPCQ
jgi:hypothetical protein